jgi:hypothetical protein
MMTLPTKAQSDLACARRPLRTDRRRRQLFRLLKQTATPFGCAFCAFTFDGLARQFGVFREAQRVVAPNFPVRRLRPALVPDVVVAASLRGLPWPEAAGPRQRKKYKNRPI